MPLRPRGRSAWRPGGPAVIRRGPLRLPGTLAVNATASAADLPRGLVTALRDPSAVVTVTVEPRPAAPTLVLFAADPAAPDDARLAAELAAADAVVAEDAPARDLVRRLGGHLVPAPHTVTGRLLVVATHGLPGRTVPRAGVRIETQGLPAQSAVAAAAPWPVPVAVLDDATADLRRTPGGFAVLLTTDRLGLPALVERVRRVRGSDQVVLAQDYADPVLASVDDLPDLAGDPRQDCGRRLPRG